MSNYNEIQNIMDGYNPQRELREQTKKLVEKWEPTGLLEGIDEENRKHGMATLLGVTLTLTPTIAVPCILVGFATVILSWKSTFRSAAGIASCFSLLMFLAIYLQIDQEIVIGLTLLAILVLFHNLIIKKRISGHSPKDDLDELDTISDSTTD